MTTQELLEAILTLCEAVAGCPICRTILPNDSDAWALGSRLCASHRRHAAGIVRDAKELRRYV